MGVFAVDMGHSLTGPGTGACSIISEVDWNRKIGKALIQLLQQHGHTVYNCTTDYANTATDQLAGICAKANAHSEDLFVSIHLNCGGGHGTEVWYYNNKAVAEKVSAAVAKSCGFTNRGAKQNTGFYVLRNTRASAILIEVCFVDSATDVNLINADKVAKAIYESITGETLSKPVSVKPKEEYDMSGIVIYGNDVDRRAAEYLADALGLPQIPSGRPYDYSKVDPNNIYAVGGKLSSYTTYLKPVNFISGSDRYETLKLVLKKIGKL